ncbi:DUF29 domain-containing protein [Acidiphilium acidophilum]|uniref:DUF29 domain-containing protein n=1 Tax=Acidiphilium acidophilum TaxID=76588 RepID=A0AAW9DKA4_ACIAO|nr:DUF29 domain-containing protein [Acidiphilium acidophilum]MDX5929365.1 DUF29 domain-containing protein [Acidiphilium acidophilum]
MQGTRDRARHSLPICRTEGRTQGLWEARSRLSVGFRPLPQTTPTSIVIQRHKISEHLTESPSLRSRLVEAISRAYHLARSEAAMETGLADQTFRPVCPWSFEQMMTEDFWPGEAS